MSEQKTVQNKVEVYYFSGTGNSLFVAKELQKRVPGVNLKPMVSLLTMDVIETVGETVGFVFPVHLTTVPAPVKTFIRKLDLKSARYIFALATRCGTTHRAFLDIQKWLKQKGKSLDSYFTLNMANNDPKFDYQVPTKEEIARLESVFQDRLDSIQKIITAKEKYHEKDTQVITPVSSAILRLIPLIMFLTGHVGSGQELYADSKCKGCGTCAKVCLSRKIMMVDEKPVWQKNIRCYLCGACLTYCPVQAVQIKPNRFPKISTENKGRYPHPYATADDIARQKD
ncbi:MAG: EFR1 family ferrodoxin [Chloroflexota bacterium]